MRKRADKKMRGLPRRRTRHKERAAKQTKPQDPYLAREERRKQKAGSEKEKQAQKRRKTRVTHREHKLNEKREALVRGTCTLFPFSPPASAE